MLGDGSRGLHPMASRFTPVPRYARRLDLHMYVLFGARKYPVA